MNKNYSSIHGYIQGVTLGLLIGFTMYSGLNWYSKSKRVENSLNQQESSELEKRLFNESNGFPEKSENDQKDNDKDESSRKSFEKETENLIDPYSRGMNFQSKTIGVDEF